MPLTDYIGQYGPSLRRLTALADAQPQSMGMADAAGAAPPQGAFGGPTPAGAGPAISGPPPQGALGGAGPSMAAGPLSGPQPGAPAAAPSVPGVTGGANGQIGLSHLLDASTHAEREHMTKQLESKGIDINAKFDELKGQGYIPKDAKMTRQEKGALLTEFGLRMMAASAQGADAFGAAGIAGQGLLESIRERKAASQKESTRQAERQQDIDLGMQEKKSERDARSADIASENKSREGIAAGENTSREKVAQIEANARLLAAQREAKATNKKVPFINQDGDTVLVDQDGSVTPVNETVTSTEDVPDPNADTSGGIGGGPGTRGKQPTKKVTVTKTRPLKAKAKNVDMNDQQVQASIERDKQTILKTFDDFQTWRAARDKFPGLTKDEVAEKIAQTNVSSRAGGNGDNDPLGLRSE